MKINQLAQGVNVCAHETEQFKTASICLNLVTDMQNVSAKALLIHLLSRTNASCPSIFQMNRKLASLYGATITAACSKVGDSLVLKLVLTSIDDRFTLENEKVSTDCTKLLCDCLFAPELDGESFTKENLEREKRLLCEKIEAEKDEKRIYAVNQLIEKMFEGQTYAKNALGDVNEIKALDGAEIFEVYKKLLSSAKVQVNVIGSADLNAIENTLKEKFDGISRDDITCPQTIFDGTVSSVKEFEEEQNVKQGKLVMGFRTDMKASRDNLAAMKVMVAIFGAGTFSKLFVNVREKMGLCYYCSASLANSKGIVLVQSGVETQNMTKAHEAILNELEDVKKGNFADEVIDSAKMSLAEMLTSTMDSVSSINGWLSSQVLEADYLSCDEYAAQIAKVTRDEIIKAANTLKLDTVYTLKSQSEEN